MTPDTFSDRKLYGILLAVAFGVMGIVFILKCCACTSSEKALLKSAVDLVAAVCDPQLSVRECKELIDWEIAGIPERDGGRE